jgi:hypothetical protein
MKKTLALLVYLTLLVASNAQMPNIVGLKFSRGFIMPHHQEIRSLIQKHITEYNLHVGWQTTGNKQWQREWNYPEVGTGFYYANLGNPDVLGDAKAAYLYYNMPFFRTQMFTMNFYLALGTAYLSNPFDFQENYTNIAIGSHYNIFANTNFEAQIRTKNFVFYTDFGLTHYSNGGSKMPNLGLNIFAASLGLKFKTIDVSKNRKMVE